MAECGTATMYSQHYKDGEKPCTDCADAFRLYAREKYRDRKPVKARVLDILETDGGSLSIDAIVLEYELRFGDPVEVKSVRRTLQRMLSKGEVETVSVTRHVDLPVREKLSVLGAKERELWGYQVRDVYEWRAIR